MPKPFENDYGSSTQINLSLPKYHEQAAAGIMLHANAIMPFTCPTSNSYKRFRGENGAPIKISFGTDNRSTLVRYVENDGRLEYRASDYSGNLYLSVASIIAAAMDGIKKKMESPNDIRVNLYRNDTDEFQRLPLSLYEAIRALKQDQYIISTMGEEFCDNYMKIKEEEWSEQYYKVSNEERTRYVDM